MQWYRQQDAHKQDACEVIKGEVRFTTYLANSGHAGDQNFTVRVVLQRSLAEEEVDLVVIPLGAVHALWHLGHGDEVGL